MDVPDLVRQAVGDEDIRAGVNLGDEDAVVFTPTRALVYRGEGLLSDEDVAAYDVDFERLAVSEGRRKTKFTMTYVDGEQSFTVPGNRTDDVLRNLIEGTLTVAGAVDPGESVAGVFRFSEMTLVVAEGRLLKHIGEYTWDADFEAFPYDDLTGLDFEEGSVATQVVLGVGDRSERIKAPNAEAGLVRKTLQEAVFAHHGVSSIEELNREVAVEVDEEAARSDVAGGLGLDSGIDPLVSDEGEAEPDRRGDAADDRADGSAARGAGGSPSASSEASAQSSSGTASSRESSQSPGGRSAGGDRDARRSGGDSTAANADASRSGDADRSASAAGDDASAADRSARSASSDDTVAVPSAEVDAADVTDQLSELTQAVERQNELLHRQQRTIEKLIEELRTGR